MGRVDIRLPDNLEKKFRQEIFRRKGMKKGNLTESITEAILLWMNDNETDEGK